MRRRAPVLLLLALASVLLVAGPGTLASHGDFAGPPHDAEVALNGPVGFAAWTTADEANFTSQDTYKPGADGALQVSWRDMPGGGNATYNATVAVDAPANVTLAGDGAFETGNVTGTENGSAYQHPVAVPFSLDDFEGDRTFSVNVTVYERNTTTRNDTSGNGTRNVTTWKPVHEAGLEPGITVKAPPAPPAEGPPWVLIGAFVALGGAVAAGGAYVVKRRRGPRAPRRSQALQELEAEDDEEVQQQVEEQRTQERQNRELRILEAKAEDHRDGIERARQRLDEGEITEHQFERIKDRKEEALEDVLDRIEEKKRELDLE